MRFTGLCSYPHGGYTALSLIMTAAAAMTTTLYAAGSCRFLAVTFVSETGDFESFFTNMQEAAAGRPTLTYKVGIGLFQFLRPFREDSSWSDGSCAGYQESMLQQLSDMPFETARFFGVIAVVFSFMLVIWALLLIFIEFNRLQIIIFSFIAMMGTLGCGMTFMVTKSAVCDGIFLESQCELDEGGLVMVAGCLMWFTALVLSCVFLRPPKDEPGARLTKAERAKIAAELAQQDRVNERPRASGTAEKRNAYSFESIESSSRSVDSSQFKKEQSRYARLEPRSRKQEASSGNRTISSESIIIDDVSHPDSMEVYFSNSPSCR